MLPRSVFQESGRGNHPIRDEGVVVPLRPQRRSSRRALRFGLLLVLAGALAGLAGCGAHNGDFMTDQRMNNGMVVILPGIEGVSRLNRDVRAGLDEAGVRYAMPIHSWGRPVPVVGALMNQMDFVGNRLAARGVVRRIAAYQQSHPGRPVYIVGHSGGGGIAVFAAEQLPDDKPIEGLILLSASISSNYDLTKALKHCRKGIVNFHDPSDTGLLGVGTALLGNVDGGHGSSAGRTGFDEAEARDTDEAKLAYSRLYQMTINSYGTPHMASTRSTFVHSDVAPWVLLDRWPVGSLARLGYSGSTYALKSDKPKPASRQTGADDESRLRTPVDVMPHSDSKHEVKIAEATPSKAKPVDTRTPELAPVPRQYDNPDKNAKPTRVWIGFENSATPSAATTRPAASRPADPAAPTSKPAQTRPASRPAKPAKPGDELPARPWSPYLPVEGT